MRTKLKKFNEVRKRFKATFVRFGTKSGFKYPLPTILFENVIMLSTNKKITNHLWFNLTKQFNELDLKEGDVVEFDARVKKYIKGYQGRREELEFENPIEEDYKLSHPTKIKLLKRKHLGGE